MARAPFIADSFTRADKAMRLIGDAVTSYITTGESAMVTLSQVSDDFDKLNDAFPEGWLETVQYINAQAAANPDDAAWQDLHAYKAKLTADFQAAKARFDAINAAIAGM